MALGCSGGLRPLVELCMEPAGTFTFHFHALEKEMLPTPVFLPGHRPWPNLVPHSSSPLSGQWHYLEQQLAAPEPNRLSVGSGQALWLNVLLYA